jgi:hypothetical protein
VCGIISIVSKSRISCFSGSRFCDPRFRRLPADDDDEEEEDEEDVEKEEEEEEARDLVVVSLSAARGCCCFFPVLALDLSSRFLLML